MKIPDWVHNEEKWKKGCRRLRALPLRIVQEEESVIEGSRKMCQCRFRMKEEGNRDFDIFVLVGSCTDHLPVGSEGQLWAATALRKKDKEIQEAESFYRDDVIRSAKKIYDRYNSYVEQFCSEEER
jgi:hypothetical protein